MYGFQAEALRARPCFPVFLLHKGLVRSHRMAAPSGSQSKGDRPGPTAGLQWTSSFLEEGDHACGSMQGG